MRDRLIGLIKSSLIKHIDKSCKLADNIADDLLAEGVIVPPCKVGDTVYGLHTNYRTGKQVVFEYDVEEVCYCSNRGVRPWFISCFAGAKFDNCDFGKTVFLTRSEAEKALAERRKDDGK